MRRSWATGWHQRALALVPLVVMLVLTSIAPSVARGEVPPTSNDPCPEPNDEFQLACHLPANEPGMGFLSHPDDVDFFRFEVLDFGAEIRLDMLESPRPYRMAVFNWIGTPLAETAQESETAEQRTLRFTPPAPGSYYILVDARLGGETAVSAADPYKLAMQPTYAGPVPNVVYAADFRRPALEFSGSRDWGRFYTLEGKYHIDMQKGGQGENSIAAATAWWGPVLADFTFVADVRVVTKGGPVGFLIGFRGAGLEGSDLITSEDAELRSGYLMLADTRERRVLLTRLSGGESNLMLGWRPAAMLNDASKAERVVDRVVVRSVKSSHLVNINGQEIIKIDDGQLPTGKLILGAISFGEPVQVIYDNVLITTPP